MTSIVAQLKDSVGNPLVGYIRITADYLITDNSGNAYLPLSYDFTLGANGSVTFNLPPSEAAQVSYRFQVYERVTNADNTTSDFLIWDFRAKVPDSTTAIQLIDLIQSTGVTRDAQDASLSTIVRSLYLSDSFWSRLQSQLFSPKGSFNATTFYRRGDIVTYDGSSYIYISDTQTQGNQPPNATFWQLQASRGFTGVGTTGNNTAYSAAGWLSQTDAPSRGAVRDVIETLATKVDVNSRVSATNAVLTNPTLAADPVASDRSSKIPSTNWVQTVLDVVRKALTPIGSVVNYAGSSAPTGWVLCDGRTLDTTTYAALYAVLGTTYNIGGEAATVFRVPDLRGRVAIGMDMMSALQGSANRITATWGRTLGGNFGAETVTLSANEIPAHQHKQDGGTLGSGTGFSAEITGVATGTAFGNTGRVLTNTVNTALTGGGAAHNNVQPSMALQYIIYAGV